MSRSSQFFGGNPTTTSIVNSYSSGAFKNAQPSLGSLRVAGVKAVLSGSLTANALATVLNVTGAGFVDVLGASSVDTTARTHRLKVTLDGVVCFDATSASCAAANEGVMAVGQKPSIDCPVPQPCRFNSSCLIEYASSVTETDKSNIFYSYRLTRG